MRFDSRQAAEDFGFEIITTWDDGMYGSRTVVYRWRETGWFASNCGEIDPTSGEEKQIYRSGNQYVGSAYHSTSGSNTYTLDPESDPILENLVKQAMRFAAE